MADGFGNQGDAEQLLRDARARGEQVAGQQRSAESTQKMQEILAKAPLNDQDEAAGFAEEIIEMLNNAWNERQFTPEQRIFSIALATVNFRQHYPEDKGGKDEFDRVAHEAHKYFHSAG